MVRNKRPKVVVLGGGTGMPVLLQGLKEYPIDLTAVVTVADDGGSTGKIRHEIDVPAPGDIRNVIAALANVEEDLYELFQYRIEGKNGLTGHALGNLLLVATNEITGNFNDAVQKVAHLFNVQANVYPIVNEPVTLHAEMDDGSIVTGESSIPLYNQKIKHIFLTPKQIKANKAVISALHQADMIVISPGSLYTSILPNLVIMDVIKALRTTEARIVYVCNLMTQRGETNNYTASDHVQAIHRHVKANIIDTIIVHNEPIDRNILEVYEKEEAFPVEVDRDKLKQINLTVIEENMIDATKLTIRHNYKKIAQLLFDLSINAHK